MILLLIRFANGDELLFEGRAGELRPSTIPRMMATFDVEAVEVLDYKPSNLALDLAHLSSLSGAVTRLSCHRIAGKEVIMRNIVRSIV